MILQLLQTDRSLHRSLACSLAYLVLSYLSAPHKEPAKELPSGATRDANATSCNSRRLGFLVGVSRSAKTLRDLSRPRHVDERVCVYLTGVNEMIPELDGQKHTYAHTLTYIPSPARPRSISS